jgi:hypothetical protein
MIFFVSAKIQKLWADLYAPGALSAIINTFSEVNRCYAQDHIVIKHYICLSGKYHTDQKLKSCKNGK